MFSSARSLLGTAGLRELVPFVSPALFDTLPPAGVARNMRALARTRVDRPARLRAWQARAERYAALAAPVELVRWVDGRLPVGETQRRARGDALLWLYFHQLQGTDPAWLDLRAERFAGAAPTRWSPGWARHAWSADFQQAICDLYAGFYDDDSERFEAALAPLGIGPAKQLFLDHFGAGDQSAVRFSTDDFRQTFQAAFVVCRDAGSQLHPDFLPFGLMLSSLYLHLEELDVVLDVRSAWQGAAAAAPEDDA